MNKNDVLSYAKWTGKKACIVCEANKPDSSATFIPDPGFCHRVGLEFSGMVYPVCSSCWAQDYVEIIEARIEKLFHQVI